MLYCIPPVLRGNCNDRLKTWNRQGAILANRCKFFFFFLEGGCVSHHVLGSPWCSAFLVECQVPRLAVVAMPSRHSVMTESALTFGTSIKISSTDCRLCCMKYSLRDLPSGLESLLRLL